MDLKEQLKSLSAQDRKELLKQLQQEEKENKRNRRDAYEGLRAQFMLEVKNRLFPVCLLYTSPSPRDRQKSRMPSSA